jgi:predicted permease
MLHAFAPIWLLVAAGYAARRWRLLGQSAATVLGWFVFHLAMPAALFVTLARTPLAGFDGRGLAAFGSSTLLVTSRAGSAPDAGRAEISVITALKLVAQPAIASAAGVLLQLLPDQLRAVVVCAGLPTAQNVFIFAQQYRVGEAIASRAVLTTTVLSLGSIAATAALLGH